MKTETQLIINLDRSVESPAEIRAAIETMPLHILGGDTEGVLYLDHRPVGTWKLSPAWKVPAFRPGTAAVGGVIWGRLGKVVAREDMAARDAVRQMQALNSEKAQAAQVAV